MKKIAALLLTTLMFTAPAYADDKVMATYNGNKVYESELNDFFTDLLASQPALKGKKIADLDDNIQKTLIEGYISSKLLSKKAQELKIDQTAEFKSKLENMKMQLLQKEIIDRHLKNIITDKKIDEEYNKITSELKGQDEIKVSHILVDSEEKAKNIKRRLNKGGKFVDLVQEFSTDDSTKSNNGSLGYIQKNQTMPEFEEVAFALKKDQISEPVKTAFGWHIIKLEDRRAINIPSKEEAKPYIISQLHAQETQKYIAQLLADAKVEILTTGEEK